MTRRKTDQADDAGILDGQESLDFDPAPTALRPRTRARGAVKSVLTAVKAPAAPRGPGRPRKMGPRTPSGRVMSKAQMVETVNREVTMYLLLGQAGWELRDPECASAATQDRIEIIAARLTNIIARNDKLLELATRTGIISDIVTLLHAAMPIARAVWAAHGPNGHGHEGQRAEVNYADYPAYPAPVAG
jgi:hypothetical protein